MNKIFLYQRLVSLVLISSWLTATPTTAQENPPTSTLSLEQQTEEVASRLEGIMDTSAQASVNPKAPNVTMTTCRVKVVDANPQKPETVIFLYQEQGLANDLSKPYRQRFLQISPSTYSQSVRSLSFKPVNAESWKNFCNKPASARTVKVSDLGSPVCSVFLKRSGDDYIGNTPPDGCPANVRGAVRITNRIVLHKTGMDTWDRGFDAKGKQVWGAQSDSYQFRKLINR